MKKLNYEFSPNETTTDMVLREEHELIHDVVAMFDTEAQVILFGPGATLSGRTVDVYIKSNRIDHQLRKRIHSILIQQYHLNNIDRICEANNAKGFQVMQSIGIMI